MPKIEYALKSAPQTSAEMAAIYAAARARLNCTVSRAQHRKSAIKVIEIVDVQEKENEKLRAILADVNAKFEAAKTIKNELRNLGPNLSEPERARAIYPSMGRIKEIVAKFYCVTVRDIISDRRTKKVTIPRQIAMYLCRELTPRSYPDIGRNFGNRDHTTVLWSVKITTIRAAENPQMREEIEALTASIMEGLTA